MSRPGLGVALAAVLTVGLAASPTAAAADTVEAACPVSTQGAFRHIHASGRFDYGVGTGDQARRERRRLAADARTYRENASIVTHTEMGRPVHAQTVLGGAGTCWRSFRHSEGDGPSENAVEWNTRWRAMDVRVVRLAERRIPARRLFATVVRLRERLGGGRLGRTVIVMVTHMPSDVQNNWDRDTVKVLAYKEALDGWRRFKARMRDRFPNARLILAADWNLDHKQHPGLRDRIRNGLGGGVRCNWPAGWDGRGTLQGTGRLIDADWQHGLVRRNTFVRADVPSSDHHPYQVRYTFN